MAEQTIQYEQTVKSESINIGRSILANAKNDDQKALKTMFSTFVPQDEEFFHVEYLGLQGIWGVGVHSFGCITNRRVATIRTSPFRGIVYQDGYLEHVNSSVILQPTRFWLYILWFITFSFGLGGGLVVAEMFFYFDSEPAPYLVTCGAVIFAVIVLLVPLVTRIYYGLKKCGLVIWIREGVPVYMFANHNRLSKARSLYKHYSNHRDSRLTKINSSI